MRCFRLENWMMKMLVQINKNNEMKTEYVGSGLTPAFLHITPTYGTAVCMKINAFG